MRQIFEAAGLKHTCDQKDDLVSYPQLANISRKCSSVLAVHSAPPLGTVPTTPEPAVPDPEFLHHLRADSPPRAHLSASTGSWSGDSGYLIANTRCSPTVAPNPYIGEWLATIALEGGQAPDDYGTYSPVRTSYGGRCLGSSTQSVTSSSDRVRNVEATGLSNAVPTGTHGECFGGISSADQDGLSDSEGGCELKPLSPNVCLERGPSRYHSAQRARSTPPTTTPTKEGKRLNQMLGDMAIQENKSRFWRPH